MKSYNETLKGFLASVSEPIGIEFVELKNALGRVLACDAKASSDYPAMLTAAMDGIACKSSDIKAGAKLRIISSLPAGSMPSAKILVNTCVKSFTGALMSEGGDTLVPLENLEFTTENNENYATIKKSVQAGFAVRQIGESYKKGEILLSSGSFLDYAAIAVLAELGVKQIGVYKKPKVALITTGSELVDIGLAKNPAQIYNSNAYALGALLENWGCEGVMYPNIKDNENALKASLNMALSECDFIITTGGVSVGEFDFMRDFVRKSGEILVDKCAIKPGRHIKIARICGENSKVKKLVFALPGFSYSAITTAILFVRPYIYKLFGAKMDFEKTAVLAENCELKGQLENFSAASLSVENGKLLISTKGKKQGSSAISTNLLDLAVLLRLSSTAKKGDIVKYIEI